MNVLSVFLLLGMLPCFGALVVPRYGQSILFLVGAAALMCPLRPGVREGMAEILRLPALSFGADVFFAKRGAWHPVWKDAVMGGFLGLAAGGILSCMCPFLFPLAGPACLGGALMTALQTAREQNAPRPAVRTYIVGSCVRLFLGFLMAGIVLGTLILYDLPSQS